jgi:hypothetical protein
MGTVLPLNPCHSLSEQSEDDIDALAFGKQQPESITNPLYETSTPAAPEPSCDPFTVSLHFTLGQGSSGVQNATFWQRSVELPRGKSTFLECLTASQEATFLIRIPIFSGRWQKPQTRGCLASTIWGVGRGATHRSKPAESCSLSYALINSARAEPLLAWAVVFA